MGAWEMLSGESSSNKTESQLHPFPQMLTPVYPALFIYKGHVPHLNFSLRVEGWGSDAGVIIWPHSHHR